MSRKHVFIDVGQYKHLISGNRNYVLVPDPEEWLYRNGEYPIHATLHIGVRHVALCDITDVQIIVSRYRDIAIVTLKDIKELWQ